MQIAFNIQIEIYSGKVSGSFLQKQLLEIKKYYPPQNDVNSFWARYYYHSAMGLIYSIQQKFLQCFNCYKDINLLMQSEKQFISDLPNIYHTNNNNMVNMMFLLENYDKILPLIQHQKTFMGLYKIKNPALSSKVFLNTSESELFLYYLTEQYEQGAIFIKKIEPELKKIDIKFSPAMFDLFFMMAVIYLGNEDYKAAIKWLNKILNHEKDVNLRRELQINTRLLYLIVLLEKEDLFFENQYLSVKRFLTNEKEFKKQLLTFEAIKILSDQRRSATKIKRLNQLLVGIKQLSTKATVDSLNPQFDFELWTEGQMIHKKLK
jgi:hypothetical protein